MLHSALVEVGDNDTRLFTVSNMMDCYLMACYESRDDLDELRVCKVRFLRMADTRIRSRTWMFRQPACGPDD